MKCIPPCCNSWLKVLSMRTHWFDRKQAVMRVIFGWGAFSCCSYSGQRRGGVCIREWHDKLWIPTKFEMPESASVTLAWSLKAWEYNGSHSMCIICLMREDYKRCVVKIYLYDQGLLSNVSIFHEKHCY